MSLGTQVLSVIEFPSGQVWDFGGLYQQLPTIGKYNVCIKRLQPIVDFLDVYLSQPGDWIVANDRTEAERLIAGLRERNDVLVKYPSIASRILRGKANMGGNAEKVLVEVNNLLGRLSASETAWRNAVRRKEIVERLPGILHEVDILLDQSGAPQNEAEVEPFISGASSPYPQSRPSRRDEEVTIWDEDGNKTVISVAWGTSVAGGGFGSYRNGTVISSTIPGLAKVGVKGPDDLTQRGIPIEDSIYRFRREIQMSKALSGHPNIVPFVGEFEFEGLPRAVYPWYANKDLRNYIIYNAKAERYALLYGAAAGLAHMHQHVDEATGRPLVHSDIKAFNILVGDDGQSKITDFGLTKLEGDMTSLGMKGVGSERWKAPELWVGATKSLASDVYAFGITMFEVIALPLIDGPFHGVDDAHLERVICIERRRPEPFPQVGYGGVDYKPAELIAADCWVHDPNVRPTMMQVAARLLPLAQHPPTVPDGLIP